MLYGLKYERLKFLQLLQSLEKRGVKIAIINSKLFKKESEDINKGT